MLKKIKTGLVATIVAFLLAMPLTPNAQSSKPYYLPYPQDCRVFFECYNGVAIMGVCPTGLFFCEQKVYCSWKVDPGCNYDCKFLEDGSSIPYPDPWPTCPY